MSEFEKALADKDFVVTVEVDPPKGINLNPLKELAAKLKERVDSLVISDNRGAVVRQSPLLAAAALKEGGAEVILTMTCRDRNRLALTSDLLAAASAGLENILLVSGDFVTLGDHPDGKPVYDLDSVQAMGLAAELAKGRDLAGGEIDGPARFFTGSSVAAGANPLIPQVIKFQKKIRAGARFFMTQALTDLKQLKNFKDQAGPVEAWILAGIEAQSPDELDAAANLAKEIKSSGLAAGVHLAVPDHQDRLPELLDMCGF